MDSLEDDASVVSVEVETVEKMLALLPVLLIVLLMRLSIASAFVDMLGVHSALRISCVGSVRKKMPSLLVDDGGATSVRGERRRFLFRYALAHYALELFPLSNAVVDK